MIYGMMVFLCSLSESRITPITRIARILASLVCSLVNCSYKVGFHCVSGDVRSHGGVCRSTQPTVLTPPSCKSLNPASGKLVTISTLTSFACSYHNVSLKKVFSRSVLCQFWQKTAQTNSLCYNNTAFLAMKSA